MQLTFQIRNSTLINQGGNMRSLHQDVNQKLILALGLATFGLCGVPLSAKAVTFSFTNITDSEFNNQLRTGELEESFVAEFRIGDNSVDNQVQRELGINTPLIPDINDNLIGGEPLVSDNRIWRNSEPVNFSLNYTGNEVEFNVGENENQLTSNAFSGDVNTIYIRNRSEENSSVALTNLMFNNLQIDDLFSEGTNSEDIDYLKISDFQEPFLLTGNITFSWEGTTPPRNSQLASQIKVGNTPVTTVPEPSTLAAIFLVGTAYFGYSRGGCKNAK
jgi:hypothetical protein